MSRLRIVIPLCLSPLAVPAFGETATAFCLTTAWTTPRCEAVRAREFAAKRNAEIDVSLATVNTVRALQAYELALTRARCKTAESASPRCETERAREFAAERNAEINASIARVAAARRLALSMTHCKTPDSTTPRCEAEHARQFAAARNAEIDASLAAVKAERAREFAAQRNAEINASLAAVAAEHARQFVAERNAEINASIAAVEFVRQRNAEIDASLAAVKAERARQFAAERNAEANASLAAVKAERARQFAAERNAEANASLAAVEFVRQRNAEINASIAAVAAERAVEFAAQRNTEINASIAAVEFARQRNAEVNASLAAAEAERGRRNAGMDTGAIPLPETQMRSPGGTLRHTRYSDPCREAGRPTSPLQFSNGSATIEDWMKPQLDRLAEIARACPAVRIEIHGHTDASAPVQFNRSLADRRAQATLAYLVDRGIDPKRLAAVGHGAREPRVIGTESRFGNDRVEFKIDDPAMNTAAARIMVDLAELLDPSYVPAVARLSP
jgi:outer membrane protein OmpA-like peptidoglycan-associated protein